MVKLKDLKVNNEYLIIDVNGCYDDIIIKFKIIDKLKGGNKKGYVNVKFLKYIEDDKERDVKYYNDEDVIEKLYIDDEGRIFELKDIDLAEICLYEAEKKSDFDRAIFDMENHECPEDYPDWDGDESIMYYIDNYNDEDEDECYENSIDIEKELDYMNINDLLKLLEYFKLSENNIRKDYLVLFWNYQRYDVDEVRAKSIAHYIYNNFSYSKITKAIDKLGIMYFSERMEYEDLY